MADETDTPDDQDTPEAEQPQAPSEDAPQAEAAAEDAPAAEAAAEDAPAAEAAAEDAPQAEAAAEDAEPSAEPAQPAEPAEQLPPKERRRRSRSLHTGTVKPPRSAEERHAERLEERRRKAARRRTRRVQERAKAAERRSAAPAPEELPPVHPPSAGTRRMRQGVVVSDKAEKTITVRIDIARRHRRYEKIVRSSSTVHAHDENNDAHEGDVVRVVESRPLSRTKRWALVDVLERAR